MSILTNEETAWQAYQGLRQHKANPQEFEKKIAAARAIRPDFDPITEAKKTLTEYVTTQRATNQPLFPTYSSKANAKRTEGLTKLYTQPLEKALPQDRFAKLEKKASFTSNPEEFKQRAINREYLNAIAGRKIPAEQYPYARAMYAKQHLGLKPEATDSEVFTAIQTRFNEELAATEFLKKQVQADFDAQRNKQPRPEPDYSSIPERLKMSVKEQVVANRLANYDRIRQINAKEGTLRKDHVEPIMADLRTRAARLRNQSNFANGTRANRGKTLPLSWNEIAAKLPQDPTEKQIVLRLLYDDLKTLPETERSGFKQIETSVLRSAGNALEQSASLPLDGARLLAEKYLPESADTKATRADNRTIRTDANTLKRLFTEEVDPLIQADDWVTTKSLVLAGQSAWMLPATLHPVGWYAIGSTLAGTSYQQARESNPEASPTAQFTASLGSGAGQAATEVILNKAGFKIIGSKLPALSGVLNKLKIANPVTRGIIGGATKASLITGTEYTEEALQSATDNFAQDLALEFSKIAPNTDWKQFWDDWLPVGRTAEGKLGIDFAESTSEQYDTLLAIAPFAVVGGGAGSFSHFKYGSALAKNRTVLEAVGVPKDTIEQMVNTTDIKKTDELFRAAFEQGLEKTSSEQKAKVLEVMREVQRLNIESGDIHRITKESEYTYTYNDPLTGESIEFETEEEALLHWRQAGLELHQENLEKITRGARDEFVDFATEEGKANEETPLRETERQEYLTEAAKRSKEAKAQLDARVKIFALERGLTPSQVESKLESLTIRSQVFTEKMRDGQLRYGVELFQNADPLDAIEDLGEWTMWTAFDQSLESPESILSQIREYEQHTGDQIVAPEYTTDHNNLMPIVEGYSKLLRATAIGEVKTGRLPETLSKWIEIAAAYGANTIDQTEGYYSDLKRAASMRKYRASGKAPSSFIASLEDALGINETAQMQRLEKKYQEQLSAEAMEGFPEISEIAKGRIPHHETLRKNNQPLAGEVRRIWESLKRPTRRRTKQGRAVDRVNEANEYFLPIGEMVDLDEVREALNEEGFDFETPADMIEALDLSISYGKKQYGTASRGDSVESFSIGSPLNSNLTLGEVETKIIDSVSEEALRLEQPKARYEDKRQLQIDFASSIAGFESSKARAESSRELDEARVLHRRDIPLPIIRQKIAQEVIINNKVEFLGSVISSNKFDFLADLAAKAQALRNPRFETFYILAAKRGENGNKIVDAMAITSRNPFAASIFADGKGWDEGLQDHYEWLKNNEADLYYIIHNHPSGDPTPSSPDLVITRKHSLFMKEKGIQMEGHIVINHNKFCQIDEDGTPSDVRTIPSISQLPENSPSSDPFAWKDPLLNFKMDNPLLIAAYASKVEEHRSSPTIIFGFFTNIRFHIVSHMAIETDKLLELDRNQIIDYARSQGATHLSLHAIAESDAAARELIKKLAPMNAAGNLFEMVVEHPSKYGGGTTYTSALETGIFRKNNPFFNEMPKGIRIQEGNTESFSLGRATLTKTDKDYLAAVEAGDMETAQRMVDEAAKKAGYNSPKLYHGTPNFGFSQFDKGKITAGNLGRGFYFTPNKNYAVAHTQPVTDRERSYDEKSQDEKKIYSVYVKSENPYRLKLRNGIPNFFPDEIDAVFAYNDTFYELPAFDVKNLSEVVVFNPNQIKSADPVTYDQDGNIIPLSQRFDETKDSISYSLGSSALARLERAISSRLTAAPDERSAFYETLRNKLASLTQRLEDMDAGVGAFARLPTDEVGTERRRILDAIAEARTIIDSLPIEARGRVSIDFADITSKETDKGRVQALMRLIDKADAALEIHLKDTYLESIDRILDLAQPVVGQNKTIKGKLTPETQRKIADITFASQLSGQAADIARAKAQGAFKMLEANKPDDLNEEATEQWEIALAEAQEALDILDTFSNLEKQTAAELAQAKDQLLSIYTTGRSKRQKLDEARRSMIAEAKREVIESLGGLPSQAKWKKRVDNNKFLDWMESLRLGHVSFHEFLEWTLPKSIFARDMQRTIRAADRAVTRERILARDRFEQTLYTAYNLTGRGRKRRLNRILADLSTTRDDWNIEIREGTKINREKMTEEQAVAILDGTMKVGWETDPIAMESLRQALLDFRRERRTARDKQKAFNKKTIQFDRVSKRGAPSFIRFTDLEAAYYLQLAAQPRYLPALDKAGFTAEVLKQLEEKLDPRTLPILAHLRKEYDAQWGKLNPVVQRITGMDMPRERNYAPGYFESAKAKDTNLTTEGTGGALSSMAAGFTKVRTNHLARPKQISALAAYWRSMETTEYYIAWAEPMRELRSVFRAPDVRRTFEATYGTRALREFMTWLDVLENDGTARAAESTAISEMTSKLLTTQSAIGLSWNLGTLFKQWSAGTGLFMLAPTTAAANAFKNALLFPRKGQWDEIWNNQAIQQRILAGMNPEDRRIMEQANQSPSRLMAFVEAGRAPIGYTDAFFTTITALTSYRYQYDAATKAGMSDSAAHAAAMDFMDYVVTRTAQPATTQDKSLNENTAKGFAKALYLFKSDPRQKISFAVSAIRLAIRGDISKPEAARRIFFSWIIYGLMAQVATDVWRTISRDDDDEENWQPQDYIAAMIAAPISGIAMIGGMIEYTIRSLVGSKSYQNNPNVLDKSVALLFQTIRSGFKMKESDVDISELITISNAMRSTSALAQIIGIYDPRAASVPAAIRLLRDTTGLLTNTEDLISPESPADLQARIIREEAETAKAATKERARTNKDLAESLSKLSPTQREKQLREMDARQRSSINALLSRRDMTTDERRLSNLPAQARTRAIERTLEALDPEDKDTYRARMIELGFLED